MALAPSLSVFMNRPAATAPAAPPSDMQQAAAAAFRQVSQMLSAAPSATSADGAPAARDASSSLSIEIDINDCPKKGALTRRATQEEICKACSVAILIRGRYKPPGDTSTDDRPLHLHVQAQSQEALDRAEAMIRDLMGPMPSAGGMPGSGAGTGPAPPPPPPGSAAMPGAAMPGLPPAPSSLPNASAPTPPSLPGLPAPASDGGAIEPPRPAAAAATTTTTTRRWWSSSSASAAARWDVPSAAAAPSSAPSPLMV